jgi:membrane-associated phospholipid phosphatase
MIRRRATTCSSLTAGLLAACVSAASAQTLPLSQDDSSTDLKPGIRRLVTSLGSDLARMPRQENALLIWFGAAAALTASRVDSAIDGASWGRGTTREWLEPGQLVGGFYMQTGGAVATYAIGRLTGSDRVAQVGSELVRAQVLTQVTTQFIKFSTQRTRPDGTTLSFPSGHSGGSFATATVLQRNFGWKAGVPAYAMAAWVAASRVQMKRHHLSDVIAGATVGILAGRAVTVGKGDNTFAVTPTVVPGGAGITFTRIAR